MKEKYTDRLWKTSKPQDQTFKAMSLANRKWRTKQMKNKRAEIGKMSLIELLETKIMK